MIVNLTNSTMIFICVFWALGRHETDLWRNVMSFWHSLADSCLSTLSKRFSVHVFGNKTRNVAIVTWNVLLAHLMLMTSNPCGGIAAAIAKNVFEGLIFVSHVLEGSLAVKSHCRSLVWSVWERRITGVKEIHDLPVDITSGHAKLVNFCGYVSSIAWHVLLIEAHFAVAWAQ